MEVCESSEIYQPQNCEEDEDSACVEDVNEPETTEEDDGYDESVLSSDYNQQLRDRIIMLRATIYDLKKQLKEEKECWKWEIQYANTIPMDPFAETFRYSPNMTYEEISQLHQETKAQLQRQLAITNYKRRLLEVENMCNMELMRVKQNVKFLQPLQMMMSEWNLDHSTSNYVDQTGDHLSIRSSKEDLSETDLRSRDSSTPLEMLSTKLYNDMNDMFNILSAHCQETIPNWNQDNTLHSQASTIFSDCGQTELM